MRQTISTESIIFDSYSCDVEGSVRPDLAIVSRFGNIFERLYLAVFGTI